MGQIIKGLRKKTGMTGEQLGLKLALIIYLDTIWGRSLCKWIR